MDTKRTSDHDTGAGGNAGAANVNARMSWCFKYHMLRGHLCCHQPPCSRHCARPLCSSSLFVPVSVWQGSASASKGLCFTCHRVCGMMARTPPGCPTASREATRNTRDEPSRGQVHPISNDTQLALQSVCAARQVLTLHAARLLVFRNEGALSVATRTSTRASVMAEFLRAA